MKTITIQNGRLRLEILPECGGKIRSVLELAGGKEWMWQNPNLPQRLPVYGQNFERHLDTGGWDEIFPSVVPSDLGGVAIPDHGDLVSLPWDLIAAGDDFLSMQVTARSVPATMRREIRLDDVGPAFSLAYTLTNHSGRALPFLVATHPLFAMDPGSRLELPGDAVLHIAGGVGDVPDRDSIPAGDLNALLEDASGGWAMKLFSEPGLLSEVALRQPEAARVRMSWDPALLPVLGLWVNHGGWTGTGGAPYHNIGIEPGNASCDALADAVRDRTAGVLAPEEVRRWEVRVEFEM